MYGRRCHRVREVCATTSTLQGATAGGSCISASRKQHDRNADYTAAHDPLPSLLKTGIIRTHMTRLFTHSPDTTALLEARLLAVDLCRAKGLSSWH